MCTVGFSGKRHVIKEITFVCPGRIWTLLTELFGLIAAEFFHASSLAAPMMLRMIPVFTCWSARILHASMLLDKYDQQQQQQISDQ
jgi:hypothetical protein